MTKLFEQQIQQLKDKLKNGKGSPSKKVRVKCPKGDKTKKLGSKLKGSHSVNEMLEKTGSRPSRQEDRETPPAMDAVVQIASKSYLGCTFTHLTPKDKRKKK